MNKLEKVELVMDATTEALRNLGLGGFGLDLNFFYHHAPDSGWQELASQADGYRRTTSALTREFGVTKTGNFSVTIFLPADYVPAPPPDVVAAHTTKLNEILSEESDNA
jgi:hypothetical protein